MIRLVLRHLGTEIKGLLRVPGFLIPTLVFPSMFFLLFAAPYLKTPEAANQTTAGFMTFAFFTVVFFQFGVGLAQERENPWSTYVRTLPLAPWVRPLAFLGAGLCFALAAAGVVAAVAALATPIAPERASVPGLLAALILGAVPHGLFGIALANRTSAKAALPIANLVYLLLAFLGGLWMPPEVLPDWARAISPWLPTRHWAELVWAAASRTPWPGTSVFALFLYTLFFGFLAVRGGRRL